MSNTRKEVAELLRRLEAAGSTIHGRSKGGHWVVTLPNGRKARIPSTPSDHRSLLNVEFRLRRLDPTMPLARRKERP
jgi:hypothetical protein